jgi:hypothetical protein
MDGKAPALTEWEAFLRDEKAALFDEMLEVCKLAKRRFDNFGIDWLGGGDDPLETVIAKANKIAEAKHATNAANLQDGR